MRFVFLLLALIIAQPAYAQVTIPNDGPQLYVSISPQYPKPNQPVTVTVQSPLTDLSQRMVIWKNNATIVKEGEGETSYQFTAPRSGERAVISVQVDGVPDNDAMVVVAPLSVDLVWESDSFAPGLYRGRHLPSLGANITLQALPHFSKDGVDIPASQLIYTWKQSGEVLLSGRGKASLTVPVAEFSKTNIVSVSVTTSDKSLGADNTASIPTADPQLRLYFEHPLYGTMYHMAVPAQTSLSDTEMTFTAIPYFTPATGANDRLFSYLWRVNKAVVDPNKERPGTITISAGPEGGAGLIELSLTHKKNFRLDAHGSWDVTFGSIAGDSNPSVDPFSGK